MEDARQRQAALEEQARLREVGRRCWLSAARLCCKASSWVSVAVRAAQHLLQGGLPACTLLAVLSAVKPHGTGGLLQLWRCMNRPNLFVRPAGRLQNCAPALRSLTSSPCLAYDAGESGCSAA